MLPKDSITHAWKNGRTMVVLIENWVNVTRKRCAGESSKISRGIPGG